MQVSRKTVRRKVVRDINAAKAAEAVGNIEPGCEIYGLSKGQFSLVELIGHCLEATGPADIIVSTWTAAGADLEHTHGLLASLSEAECSALEAHPEYRGSLGGLLRVLALRHLGLEPPDPYDGHRARARDEKGRMRKMFHQISNTEDLNAQLSGWHMAHPDTNGIYPLVELSSGGFANVVGTQDASEPGDWETADLKGSTLKIWDGACDLALAAT